MSVLLRLDKVLLIVSKALSISVELNILALSLHSSEIFIPFKYLSEPLISP